MWTFVIVYFAGALWPAVETGPFVTERECIAYMSEWVDKLPEHVEALATCMYKPPVMLASLRPHR